MQQLAALAAVLTPLSICVYAGSIHASLWLDEIAYWDYEKSSYLRTLETRRPGSLIAPFFMNYFYCDVQRAVHWVVERFGLTIQSYPELYLRFLSLVSFAAAAVLIQLWTFRETKSWWWSIAAALVVSSSPLLLFYAFEARVSAFATLGVIVYLALLSIAGRSRVWLGAGAILGIFLAHLHVWTVCLLGALCIAAMIRYAVSRNGGELRTTFLFAAPGAIFGAAEAAFITLTYPAGGQAFPLYTPRPAWLLQQQMFSGVFSALGAAPATSLKPFEFVPSFPLLALFAAILVVLYDLRRSPRIVIPAAAVLAMAISIAVGARFGHLIAPRYQVPLFGALFFSFSFAAGRRARLVVALLAVLTLAQVPTAIRDVARKGNGKTIAAFIENRLPRERSAVLVQHPVRLGYPDPLHNFVLHFYLDELHPAAAPLRIYELPALRDITDVHGLRDYFGGGEPLALAYAARPETEWHAWLTSAPYDRLWLVAPVPMITAESKQILAFRKMLLASGYARDPEAHLVNGYPLTIVEVYNRR